MLLSPTSTPGGTSRVLLADIILWINKASLALYYIAKSSNCTVKWWCHPMCASLTIAMQNPCLVYTVIIHMAVWLQVCCTVSGPPMQGTNLQYYSQACGHKIMYLYSIYLVSTTCCDATITLHKRNTNIQELCTLPNEFHYVLNNPHAPRAIGTRPSPPRGLG